MKVAVGLRRVAAGKRTSGRRAAQIAPAEGEHKELSDTAGNTPHQGSRLWNPGTI